MYALARARIGAPVAGPGKLPPEPAMSRWVYFKGISAPDPCLSSPEATTMKAGATEIRVKHF